LRFGVLFDLVEGVGSISWLFAFDENWLPTKENFLATDGAPMNTD